MASWLPKRFFSESRGCSTFAKAGPGALRLLRWIPIAGAVFLLILIGLWSILAIYFSNLPGGALRAAAAAFFGLGFAIAFLWLPNRRRTAAWLLAAFTGVLVWWCFIPPSNHRDWIPEHAVLPRVEIEGDLVTIRNIRNFDHRSLDDFTVRYYDRTFDLKDLQTMDFVKSHWGGIHIAHTMLCFGFRGGEYLAVSAESRRERGEPHTALRGLFKQYEITYVLGDERDLIRLRTSFRKEDVYLYPTRSTPGQARVIFLDILKKVNELAEKPEFYNSITHNCTGSLEPHLSKVGLRTSFDIRMLLNGHTDELAYERGAIDTELPFDEIKELCRINQYLEDDAGSADFSRRIRGWKTR